MANIKLIPILRDRTGAGMMDCRKALDACNGNMEEAEKVLQKLTKEYFLKAEIFIDFCF